MLVIGAGGLGCPAAAYLAGAGVGTLGIVDGDTVEASNLHRQIGHSTAYVGQPKAESLVAYCQKFVSIFNHEKGLVADLPSGSTPCQGTSPTQLT